MSEPHRTASGAVTESPLVLVDVTTDQGVTGHGLLFTYTAAALKPVADLVSNLAPLIVGRPLAPADLSDGLFAKFKLLGTQGLVGMAIAGLDMALWDALARTLGVSLTRLLGGNEETAVPAYGAVGYEGATGSARTAEDWARRGFRGVKAKIGYPTVSEDIDVITAIRRAVGPDMAIMVDYNQSLTATEAVERLRQLDDLGLTWVEEPTLAHDYDAHAVVARAIATPIQSGENWWGPLDVRHAIQAQASDFVMLEVMKLGGITGWKRAAALAETHGLKVSTHLWTEVSTALLCTTPMRHWLEYCDWWNPILAEPLVTRDGLATAGAAPGSGVSWNETAVQKYLA